MLVTLICEDRIYGILLPEKARGQYWIEDKNREVTDKKRKLLGIEERGGAWKIVSGKKYCLYEMDQKTPLSELILKEGELHFVRFLNGRKGYIFTESYTTDCCTFQKYQVKTNTVINIGQDKTNQIAFENPFVSGHHAQLSLSGNTWTILDYGSKNGVYVNERRLQKSTNLNPGDVVYIMGMKIVVGDHFIAINNPGGQVVVDEQILPPYKMAEETVFEEPEEIEERFYYRSPQFSREIQPLKLKIDAPSNKENEDDTPMILTLAPSLIMGVASFSTGILTMVNTRNNGGSILTSLPTMLMSVSMLVGMVLFPFIMKRRDRKKRIEKETERREKYLKYLTNIRAEIYKAAKSQKEILLEKFPMIIEQYRKSNFYDILFWSRVIGRDDFLTLRLGTGNIPMIAELSFPEQRFSIDDDKMRTEVNRFSEEKKILEDVPVTYSLLEHRVSGIVGNGIVVNGILHNLIMQIAALHSYDEVKIIFICDERDFPKYSYVRWMQHIWDNDFRTRYLATTPEEVRELSVYFTKIIENYKGKENPCPHYVIISTSKALSDSCAFLSEMLKQENLKGFSYMAVYDELKNLPKECSAVIQVNESQGIFYNYTPTCKEQINFVPDKVAMNVAKNCVMEMAEYRLDLQSGKYALPGMLTFLDMFQVGKYEHLNISGRWKESNPVLSLQTPIGINTDGRLFYLDIHEKEHGPHGLIAGMTGSGKSEFIITYILSLAVNYSPDDIAFILIDYKGGGLVGAFDNEQYKLPHLAGTITNLDGASINRSLLSIQSELRRRQAAFNEARSLSNEGTMDIYKYQKLYRNGVVNKPIPHLLIVSDEFAELKSQQPEFMAQLISTARIGRSLGVHLILATQKPSGVVSEQIWANSKFKICLRVQDRADSMDMLKRPDAAELIESGRFFLQVGYNELFELGQSAWCGAPYVPSEQMENESDTWIQLIDHQGKIIEEVRPQKEIKNTEHARKQIVEVAGYIAQIAKEEGLSAVPLWLPEIPAVITLGELEEKYQYQTSHNLNPIIGELDDPFNQEQRLLTMPISERGNTAIYGVAGSGKDNLLITVLYSLYMHHNSKELHAYILDFGAESLRMFEAAPQTGDFMVSGEEEKVNNLFRFLHKEIANRKKLFAEYGGDFTSYRKSGKNNVPNIVIIINDYIGFSEQFEEINDRLPSLTRDCTKYGIFFIVSCTSSMGIRYKLQQNFTQTFVLQLNDKADYVSLLGNTGGVFPSKIYGRGIYREKEVYEFQSAYVTEKTEKIADVVRAFCRHLKEIETEPFARPIAVMPKTVTPEYFSTDKICFQNMPIGVKERDIENVSVNMEKGNVMHVLAMDRQDTAPFANALCELLQKCAECEIYVMDPGNQLHVEGMNSDHYIVENLEEGIVKLFDMTVERHNMYKRTNGNPVNIDMHPVVVLVMGLNQVKKAISEDAADKLKLILEKTSGKYQQFYWIMDDYSSANDYCTEEWCRGEGLWIGSGITDQIRLKVTMRGRNLVRPLDFTRGYLVKKGKAEGMKLLTTIEEEEAEDE